MLAGQIPTGHRVAAVRGERRDTPVCSHFAYPSPIPAEPYVGRETTEPCLAIDFNAALQRDPDFSEWTERVEDVGIGDRSNRSDRNDSSKSNPGRAGSG